MNVDKIYFINLADKTHRWYRFYDIHPNIDRFDAIDSRNNFKVCESIGLILGPVGLADKLYFSNAPGAVGAYCSHYLIWTDIIKNNYKNALVFEDDVMYDDVVAFLNTNKTFDATNEFVQLNKRWHDKTYYYNNFDGLESYYLTNKCAEILIANTHNASGFQNKIKSGPFGFYTKSSLENSDLFKKDSVIQNWTEPNTIRCAVDKFVGYSAHPEIKKNRIKIDFFPSVGINSKEIKSDIYLDEIPWHEQSEEQIHKFTKSELFEYWKTNLYLSPNHVPCKKTKISFLTSSMNRCNDLKKTFQKNVDVVEGLNIKYEYVLLNYNSSDDMDSWFYQSHFSKNANIKYIKTSKYKFFSMSIAKNILGKNANGQILCWVDADNLITKDFIISLLQNYKNDNFIFTAVDYNKNTEGLTGRISCKQSDFYEVGGYDESLSGWGYEDIDFCKRLELIGLKMKLCRDLCQVESSYDNKFDNYENKPKLINTHSSFRDFKYTSNLHNYGKSRKNLLSGKYKANLKKNDWGLK